MNVHVVWWQGSSSDGKFAVAGPFEERVDYAAIRRAVAQHAGIAVMAPAASGELDAISRAAAHRTELQQRAAERDGVAAGAKAE